MRIEDILKHIHDKHQRDGPLQGATVQSIISTSDNIYENLAVEEALMRAADLEPIRKLDPAPNSTASTSALQLLVFSYINTPCAVVGRNQCVFTEVNVPLCRQQRALVARRSSGGGTVFHDRGNVNFTFLTHRSSYDPVRTIGILIKFLVEHYSIDPSRLTTTGRHDIFLDGRKITGSAMRIQKDVAFHHCTLLVASDREALSGPLRPSGAYVSVTTTSTTSVRSPVTTLRDDGVVELDGLLCHDDAVLAAARITQSAFLAFVKRFGVDLYISSVLANDVMVPQINRDGHEPQRHRNMEWGGGATSPNALLSDMKASLPIVVVADTRDIASTPFIDAVGRRVPLRSHAMIADEALMLSSPEWIYGAMPALEVTVNVHRSDVQRALPDHPEAVGAARNDALRMMIEATFGSSFHGNGQCEIIVCRITIERGCISAARWFHNSDGIAHSDGIALLAAERSAAQSCWFDALLSAYAAGMGVCGVRGCRQDCGTTVYAELSAVHPSTLWDQMMFSAGDSVAAKELEVALNATITSADSEERELLWKSAFAQFLTSILQCSIDAAGMV
jgi:lipoate-protein ligase A